MCAELRAIVDPEDEHHWNKDGLMREVSKPVQDLRKAIWYIERRISVLRAEGFSDE